MQQLVNICIVIALMLLAGCSKNEPIRIGVLAGMSGRVADLGVAGRNGMMLAVEQRNAGGGINGRPAELLVRDDAQNRDVARKAVAELLAAKVELIIGPMTSSMAMATMDQINASTAVYLSPTVTTTDLTGKDDHFLRVIGDTRTYAAKSARYQIEKLQHKTVAVIYESENRSYTESWFKDFAREYEAQGGKLLKVVTFASGTDTAFMDKVKDLMAVKPQLVLVISNAVDAAQICQQVRKLKPGQAIAMSEWASTERFIELAGAAAEGLYVAQFIDRNSKHERYQSFRKAYKERFGGQEPGFAGLAGYDAALAAMEGFAKRNQGESIKQALIRINRFQGVQHDYTLDRFGDAVRPNYVTVVENGNFKTLE